MDLAERLVENGLLDNRSVAVWVGSGLAATARRGCFWRPRGVRGPMSGGACLLRRSKLAVFSR